MVVGSELNCSIRYLTTNNYLISMYFQTINSNSPALHAQVIGIKHSHSVSWEISVWN